MNSRQLICSLDRRKVPVTAGNKALNLYRLIRKKYRVPKTYVLTWEAYQRYRLDDLTLIDDLKNELSKILKPEKQYAVRSSANIEDSFNRSFAGQFKTSLNNQGFDQVIQGIWSVWSSTQAQSVKDYLYAHKISEESLCMAVLIQEMLSPVFSGVSLSRNPVTSADEIVVEAVSGSGVSLVQGGHTPDRWVYKWGNWLEKATGSKLPLNVVEQIALGTEGISKEFGVPVDLEWVFDGENLYWVQIREITGLNQTNVYSNYISREFIPGMIKPLIYSVNIPLVNKVWIDWISEITGDLDILPEDLAKSFFYHVYFNMGVLGKIFSSLGFPADSVEMLMGTLPKEAARPSFKPTLKTISRLPWLLAFVVDKLRFESKMKKALEELEPLVSSTDISNLDGWDPEQLLTAVDRHFSLMQEVAYYNVLGPLLMGMYNSALARVLFAEGIDFSSLDLQEGIIDFQVFNPSFQIADLHQEFLELPSEIQQFLEAGNFSDAQNRDESQQFFSGFDQLIRNFGHLSDNGNDFSAVPWRETPELVMELIRTFEPLSNDEQPSIKPADLELRGVKRLIVGFLEKRAREFQLLRERVSSIYTYGYGLFRYYYLALGSHLVDRDILDQREDIFFLTDPQIRALLNGKAQSIRETVEKHKRDMEKYQGIPLPTVIFGEELPLVEMESSNVLRGIASSGGVYTGEISVVSGLQDFSKIRKGDVLVVPFSDVGWTPLFRKAGAVIAESGGLLSHSSIVAREYNIPAVVNVPGATNLANGTTVTVDGHQGKVFIDEA
jgi:pyruvate,water dikinase